MHSYKGESCIFHFDAGLEGDLIIQSKDGKNEIRIDATDVLKLVAFEHVLRNKIEKLEEMDYRDLLNQ